jgi:hypothetical protein
MERKLIRLQPMVRAMALVLIVLLGSAAARARVQHGASAPAPHRPPEEDRIRLHLEVPEDPPVHVPPEARRTSPAGRWSVGPFESIQVNVDADGNNILGDAANEPSIAIDPTNSDYMVIGWRQFDTIESNFREAGWAYSHNAGQTWTFPGVLEEDVFRSDPVLDADADGVFYFYSLSLPNPGQYSCEMFISSDSGVTWTGPIDAFGGDKAWMAIDRTGGIGDGNIYAAWDYAGCCGNDWFTRSMDGGLTYADPIPIPEQPMWGVTTVGPDGEVYVGGRLYTTATQFAVARSSTAQIAELPLAFDFATIVSLDGSLRGTCCGGPNPNGLLGQVWVATDHSDGPSRGNVYLLASVVPFEGDDPLQVMFCRSTNGGETFSDPIRVNDDPPGTNAWQWFGTMSVAPGGRIDVVFNDTRNTGAENLSELFYTYSTDTGITWSTNIPVSPVFDSHIGWPDQNKLGDYYDMISDEAGVKVAYAATFNDEQDVYYLRIALDCNNNGIHDGDDIASGTSDDCNLNQVPDECDIAEGTSQDINDNQVPDECENLSDINGDGLVDLADFSVYQFCLMGPGFEQVPTGCTPEEFAAADLDEDNDVDLFDFSAFELHFMD